MNEINDENVKCIKAWIKIFILTFRKEFDENDKNALKKHMDRLLKKYSIAIDDETFHKCFQEVLSKCYYDNINKIYKEKEPRKRPY